MQVKKNFKAVTIKPKDGGWELKHDGKSGTHSGTGPGSYPVIVAGRGENAQLIQFDIQDSQGSNITFSSDPIWVKEGQAKPGKGDSDPQIPLAVPFNGGKSLAVLDLNDNPNPISLSYQLNFNGHVPLDPIIDNGGRPTPPPPPPPPGSAGTTANPKGAPGTVAGMDVSCLLIGLVIGLVIGFILCRLSRRSDRVADR